MGLTLEEWRKRQTQGEDAELPSGLVVQIKYASLLDLALAGQIPQTLASKVEQVVTGGQVRNLSLKEFGEYAEIIDIVCRACIVGPEGLEVEELPYLDRVSIFNWANDAAVRLKTFRRKPNGTVEPLLNGNLVRGEAE